MATKENLTSGLSMGKLGDFEFFMDKNAYEKISQTITASFGSFKPIKGQEQLSDSGGFESKISMNGVLVVQPLDALKKLEDFTKKREPIRFTTLENDIDVVITSLATTKKNFLDDGKHTVQTYNLSLKEVYDELV